MSLSLPNSLNFMDIKKNSYPSRSNRRIFNSTNQSTFTGSKTTVIRIMVGGAYGDYIDTDQSYLKFTINNTTKNNADPAVNQPANLDNHASCFFSRLEIYHNGKQIEDIDKYNLLNSVINDVFKDQLHMGNIGGMIEGTDEDGENGVQLAAGGSRTFCLRLPSGFLNSMKMLPLTYINGEFEIRLTLEDPVVCLKSGAATNTNGYTMTDVSFVGQVITLDSSAQAVMDEQLAMNGGVLSWSSESWHHHSTSKAADDTTVNALIPFKDASLKSIYVVQRESEIGTVNTYSLSIRAQGGLKSYQFDVGGEQSAIVNYSATEQGELLMELLRAVHNSSSIHPTRIYDGTWANKFLYAHEMESFQNSDTALSGTDTINKSIYLRASYDAGTLLYISFFGMYDVIYSVVDGELVSKF